MSKKYKRIFSAIIFIIANSFAFNKKRIRTDGTSVPTGKNIDRTIAVAMRNRFLWIAVRFLVTRNRNSRDIKIVDEYRWVINGRFVPALLRRKRSDRAAS